MERGHGAGGAARRGSRTVRHGVGLPVALWRLPRVRSRVGGAPSQSRHRRLIPACAEQTTGRLTVCAVVWAHPRVRGAGSLRFVGGNWSPWLIPACAEQTSPCHPQTLTPQAHPRVRGADGHGVGHGRDHTGSSPRARSRHLRRRHRWGERRLLPACAEQTVDRLERRDGGLAPPRVRGADPRWGRSFFISAGWSSLSRSSLSGRRC